MPLPSTFIPFTNNSTVTATSVNSRVEDVEQFINGDIETSDLPITPWVDSSIIVGPGQNLLVYSSAALFFHYELSTEYIPIPGLNATIHVAIPDGYPRDNVDVHIRASFFAENSNSVLGVRTAFNANTNSLVTQSAEFSLFANETRLIGTARRVYAKTDADHDMTAQNISMVGVARLSRGIHNLGVRIKPIDPGNIQDWQHTVIRHRTLNIEVHYL